MFTMTPTRRSQPYRDAPERPQTPQLHAMLQGRPLHAPNPMDQKRFAQRLAALILGH